jgi:hypothetical protein
MNDDDKLIFRHAHKRDYTVIQNSVLCDKRLSWRARGLFAFLLSKPDDWKVIVSHLVDQAPKDGKASVTAALQELQGYGYLRKRLRPKVGGRFDGWDILLYEIPDGTVSDLETRTASDSPSPVNQTLLSTDLQSTDLQKKEETSSISDSLTAEQRRTKMEETRAALRRHDPISPLKNLAV